MDFLLNYYWCQYNTVSTAQQRTTTFFWLEAWVIVVPMRNLFLHHLRFFEDLIEYVA